MKTVKSLLLGTAAGFVAFTGAQAADLPMAEPVEYVKICDTYGKGYFYIPGTDTCLKLSGYVRFSTLIDFNGKSTDTDGLAGEPEDDNVQFRSRGDVRFDARSETEWGTLRSFIEMRGNAGFNGGNSDFDIEQAFIQFAGLTIGRAQSFFDYVPYDSYEDFFSDRKVNTVAYTASFGSGFAATIGVEDKYNRDDYSFGTDQVWPNVVAALRVDQAWGSAQVSGAIQDNVGDGEDYAVPFTPEDDIGWAIQAGASFNLPTAHDGSFVSFQGVFTEGAIGYVESFTLAQLGTLASDQDAFGNNNEFWAVGGAIGFQATETVNLQVVGMYFEYDGFDPVVGTFDTGFTGFKVEGKAVWTPVDNLDLGIAAQYANIEFDVPANNPNDPDGAEEDFRLELRAQRSF